MGQYAGFSRVKLTKPQRSAFDLSHEKRLTMRPGKLVPILVTECVPSDSFDGGSEVLLRLAPLLAPIYDRLELFVHYFFVPNRLLWEDWEQFITGGRLGVGLDPEEAPIPPFFDIGTVLDSYPTNFDNGTLADYMGVPNLLATGTSVEWTGVTLDAMPFMAYQLIWFEYYRDRNFVPDSALAGELPSPSGENPSPQVFFALQSRNYKHDYFTSALPFTQRGEEVLLPIAGDASVTYLHPSRIVEGPGTLVTADSFLGHDASTAAGTLSVGASPLAVPDEFNVTQNVRIENIDTITVDGTTTINDFRAAYALQVWLERNAIGGSRYTESTEAHFGVKPQDSRLQRPEYIGGGRIPVKISEVVSTAWSTNDADNSVPLANMGGHGVTYGNTNRFKYFCTEHGFIIGIASIMSPPSYQQGLPRMFRRRTFLDYPWPTFAKLGEQVVYDYEIYATPASLTEDVETGELPDFGYQSRYADWKYMCTTNHGQFRTTLLFWTLTRIFDDAPVLSAEFVQYDDELPERIFAVQDEDSFWLYVHNKIHVKRPLPYFGTPNTMGFV